MGNPSVRDRREALGNVTHGGTRLPRRNRKRGDGHSPPNGVARPDSIPTSARYVPWEPEAGDCLRPPGPRRSNLPGRPDHESAWYPDHAEFLRTLYVREVVPESELVVQQPRCTLALGAHARV